MAKSSTRSRISEIGEESRQRILDAAEQLFLERGYEKTTLADVGRLAGISYGSIPWHFENKQGLLFAVVERAWNSISHTGPLPAGLPGLDIVLNQMEKWDRSALAPIMYLLYQLSADPDSHWLQRAIAIDEARHQALAEWIEATLGDRTLPNGLTPMSVAHFWTAASRGIFIQAVGFQYVYSKMSDSRAVLRLVMVNLLGLTDHPDQSSPNPMS